MTPFEYVTVLISIILGMGITQIVTGIADIVHQWHRVKVYWPHLLWIVLVFFLQIQEWWATYELRHFNTLRLPTFFFVVLYPINLFILARILFPLSQNDEDWDLRAFYFANFRKFFLWAANLPVLSIINNVFVTDHPVQSQYVQLLLASMLFFLSSRRHLPEAAHKGFALVLLLITLASLALMWNDALTT